MDHSKLKFICLDLEMNQPSNRIIQIGACIIDWGKREVVRQLSILVDPEEEISEYIENLTGVTNERVKKYGVDLMTAYEDLKRFREANEAHRQVVEWGCGDTRHIREQMSLLYPRYMEKPENWFAGIRTWDVKTLHQATRLAQGVKMQGGLAKALTQHGLRFEGRKHDALDDAVNTARLFCVLIDKIGRGVGWDPSGHEVINSIQEERNK